MKPFAKSATTVVCLATLAAFGAPLIPATAAPALGGPAVGGWTKPTTVARGAIAEVLAPPGLEGFYGGPTFVWRKGPVLSVRTLGIRRKTQFWGVSAAAVSDTALAWHRSTTPYAGVALRAYRPIGSMGGDPGWAESKTALVPDSQSLAVAPELAVADDPYALTSAVAYSAATSEGVQLRAAAFSTGGSFSNVVTVGDTQVLTTTPGTLDDLTAVHGKKLVAVAYRLTATDGATSVAVRTSPVTNVANQLTWGPETVVCQAPAGAAVECDEPTFGRDRTKRSVHLFLRGPDGLQHRTLSATGVSEPVRLGPATGPIAVTDTRTLSVAATHGDRTTLWRIRASQPATRRTVRTPGVRRIALGQHRSGRMLAWSDGTDIGTWSDARRTEVEPRAIDVPRVTQLGISGGRTPRLWYVDGAGRRPRLVTRLFD